MNSMYDQYIQNPSFEILLQELRNFEFVSYISVHASLNNIAVRGDESTKQFIRELKGAFGQDLNRIADFLKEYMSNLERAEETSESTGFTLPDISEISRTIMALSFPFLLKSYNRSR